MKQIKYLFFLFFLLAENLCAQSRIDSVLNLLNKEIAQKNVYITEKENVLKGLKNKLQLEHDSYQRFLLSDRLYDEYKSYQYDSAYVYAMKTTEYAGELHNKDLKVKAQSNLLFCFLSSGLFKEAVDVVNATTLEGISSQQKAHFYSLCARLYSDLINYNNIKSYKELYKNKSIQYCDSALNNLDPSSYQYHQILALKEVDAEPEYKIAVYKSLIDSFDVNKHQKAINTSNLANIFLGKKDTLQAIYFLAQSAIADITSATMETTSKTVLAECLYNRGDIQSARAYIYLALEEANFYNARHRIISINSILPIIEKDYMGVIEKQRNNLQTYFIWVVILLVVFVIALLIIFTQYHKLKGAKQIIQEHMDEVFHINQKLNKAYDSLKDLNEVKDVYIMQALYAKSDYIDKLEAIFKKLEYRIKAKQYHDIYKVYGEFNLKQERKNLFSSFDQAFLILYPSFIDEFNKLFPEEEQIHTDGTFLTPELRIFALIRLGISENEKIAKFLNLSMNTIYSYKAKVKSKTLIPKEDFEDRIMQIQKG